MDVETWQAISSIVNNLGAVGFLALAVKAVWDAFLRNIREHAKDLRAAANLPPQDDNE